LAEEKKALNSNADKELMQSVGIPAELLAGQGMSK